MKHAAKPSPVVTDSDDLYVLLGVERTATKEEITLAYRRLMMALHPDRNGGVESPLHTKIAKAYETLTDPGKRAFYDATGLGGFSTEDLEIRANQLALERLKGVCAGLCTSPAMRGQHKWTVNIPEQTAAALRGELQNLNNAREATKVQKAQYEELISRFTKKTAGFAGTQLGLTLKQTIEGLTKTYELQGIDQDIFARAIKIVATYDYEADALPPQSMYVQTTASSAFPGSGSTMIFRGI